VSRARVVVVPAGASEAERDQVVGRAAARGFPWASSSGPDGVGPEPGGTLFVRTPDGITRHRPDGSEARVTLATVGSPTELAAALHGASTRDAVLIRWTGDRVIPLESAVAAERGRAEIWVITDRISDVPAALGALERGADLVFVEVRHATQVDELERFVEALGDVGPPLVAARIVAVEPAGLGDRVLVDFTSILTREEGILVGSAASFLFHVASEAEGSAFSRPRSFRVNAGAAHSYSLLADGSTRYLAELEAGDRVWVGDASGRSRSVRVGRVKVERRPLVMIRATALDRTPTLFAQEAETVRLSTASGRIAVTSLRAGVDVLGRSLPPGRHLGAVVDETVDER
jgi:3-dehydroquinate synthase II